MPFATGSANNLNDLLTAVQTLCTANGWTLSGQVLNKGGCFTSLAVNGNDLEVQGGTGIDGSNQLTVPGPDVATVGATYVPLAMAFPCTYYVHVLANPDEVYCFINHSTTYWQWLAFGLSPVAGLPGTGGWYAASTSQKCVYGQGKVQLRTLQAGDSYGHVPSGALFGTNGHGAAWTYNRGVTSFFHVGLDGLEWANDYCMLDQYIGYAGISNGGAVDAWTAAYPLLERTPNLINDQDVLIPLQILFSRASSKLSLVGQLGHSRYCRNDNHDDGAVITIGPDSWKIYPHVRKDITTRDGTYNATHSGTLALAVRYDG